MLSRVVIAAVLAGVLGYRGLKKQSLSLSGAIAAFFVGFLTLASGTRFGATDLSKITCRIYGTNHVFLGLLLLGFYYSGSKLTKIQARVKLQLDANYKPGGQRSARQVLACSLLGTLIAVYYVAQYGDDASALDFKQAPMRSFLVASYIGHYACCAADTWAAELGVLSSKAPRLITTLRRVPSGTNGGVSMLGLFASLLGGTFIGALYYVWSLFSGTAQKEVLLLGAVMGLFGSVLDSVLGATLQTTYFDRSLQRICDACARNSDVEHICGANVLSNEQVNVASVWVTTALSGIVATILFP
ncbi:hypothetical protein CCR75_008349 [Bremia lactucae]|uniref:Transmembrane protein 19 n=1 Tax=Bremia lactucae TaxID=4779 RepID=A0A976FN98_BRELC|nr:hypothetical protein CCR75_008349 [Bremia lactucae]